MEQVIQTIPTATMVCTVISLILSVGTPIGLMIYFFKKCKARMMPVLIGAGIFILFAGILEQMMHAVVIGIDSPVSKFVNGNNVAFIFYGILAAGVFEETGRYIAFKYLFKKYPEKQNALMYGAGHGGIEAIMFGGVAAFSNIALFVTLNSMGIESYLKLLPEETAQVLRPTLESVYTTSAYEFLFTGIERVGAIAFHISMSVLVFMAVYYVGKKYLYPVAIGLHMLMNLGAALYQRGIIRNIFVIEVYILVVAIGVSIFAYREYKRN